MIAITNEEKYLAKIAGEEITTPEPVLRKEQYLSAIANGGGTIPELPITREEQYLAILAGENYAIPTPETRLERYMAKACGLDIDTPTPITNVEYYWAIIAEGESWAIITITGTLPLTFEAKGEALTNYRLYGTSEGAGVQTSGTEPAGYKIPLTVTSGEQSGTYPIYIGDTQLMDEEYVDYQEQKIYRTILLTTHDNKDFITSDNKRFCVRRSNNA